MDKILISACLAGFSVRYNGTCKTLLHRTLVQWHTEGRLVMCCPELAAGFATPRPPAEIIVNDLGGTRVRAGAKVIENTGRDVTDRYVLGAYLTLQMARFHDCRYALLTDGSPSCGSKFIYSGDFDGHTRKGNGVTAQLLRDHGIRVFSHLELPLLITMLSP